MKYIAIALIQIAYILLIAGTAYATGSVYVLAAVILVPLLSPDFRD